MTRAFEWDQAKSDRTLAERGFDFTHATRVFEGPVLVVRSDREDEKRWHALGVIEGLHYSVVYTKRETLGRRCRRIVSARRARAYEREAYDARVRRERHAEASITPDGGAPS